MVYTTDDYDTCLENNKSYTKKRLFDLIKNKYNQTTSCEVCIALYG